MALPPVAVFIGGQQLEGYTWLTVTRSKEDLTGSCNIDLFFNYMPTAPVVVDAAVSKDLWIYIGGQLAFNGTVDKRTGKGVTQGRDRNGRFTSHAVDGLDGGSSRSASIGPSSYEVTISGRGKTKRLVDSSHQVKPYNMLKTNTRAAVQKLIEPFDIEVEFIGTQVDLDKVRFRDGSKVVEELRRIATENCYYIYETRDGKLRITDGIGPGSGDSLILGQNILTFSASQDESGAQSEVIVKGQRTEKEMWGEQAVLNQTTKQFKDSWVQSFSPIVVQHYGNATPEALERRGRFEMNKRSSRSKSVTVDVFHVQASGQPWDIGNIHYVEVPPEGIFDNFECTALTYTVTNDNTLKTTLTLSPPPVSGGAGASGLDSLDTPLNSLAGQANRGALGVTFAPGGYPSPWTGPVFTQLLEPTAMGILAALSGAGGLEQAALGGAPTAPPLQLPAEFEE